MTKKKYGNALKELISTSVEITGSAAGTGLGLLLAGPGGALLGAAAAPAVTRALKAMASEIKSRVIGNREEVRVGAAFTYSLIKIEKNLKQGKEIQSQYLNNYRDQTRSAAEEALEGVLLAAQKEFEEKKIKYIGNFYGNVLFEYHDRAYISSTIKLIESLSYRQLVMIKLFKNINKYKLDNPIFSSDFDFNKLGKYPRIYTDRRVVSSDVMIEARDLSNKMIIENEGAKEHLYFDYHLTFFGKQLMNLMELSDIPDSEVEACSNKIRGFVS